MDIFKQALLWIGIGAVTSPIWGALLWVLWEGRIRPRLIPGTDIDSLAAAMVGRRNASRSASIRHSISAVSTSRSTSGTFGTSM